MGDNGLVSLIIPVYGVEAYLSQCLESVCKQSYNNLEIIVVDDESPDLSGKIADEFAKVDARIKVLHIKNRGAAGARNVGLDICTGNYIMFVDSDDWLEIDAVEKLLKTMHREKCDIVQFQHFNETLKESVEQNYNGCERICSDTEFIQEMIKRWEYVLIWNKLYRKDVLSKIRFLEGRCIDDEFYTYKVIMKASKIALCNQFLYHYRLRKSGAMGNSEKEQQRFVDQVDFITYRYPELSKKYPELKGKLLCHMMEVLMYVMRNGAIYKEIYKYAKAQVFKYGIYVLATKAIDFNVKKSVFAYIIRSRSYFLQCNESKNNLQQDYFE